MNVLDSVVQEYIKSDIPAFGVGDTVKVHVKIKERKQRKNPDIRRLCFKETERRHRRDIHSKKDRFRCRC